MGSHCATLFVLELAMQAKLNQNSPRSAFSGSQVLGLKEWPTMPALYLIFNAGNMTSEGLLA